MLTKPQDGSITLASNVGFSSAMRLLAVKLEFVEVDSFDSRRLFHATRFSSTLAELSMLSVLTPEHSFTVRAYAR